MRPQARERYSLVTHSDKDLYTIAALTASFKVDGHRADIVILRTARSAAMMVACKLMTRTSCWRRS
ncbi:MAG: hypothetical protein R3E79_39465 [Caldilineaceae bacterium]